MHCNDAMTQRQACPEPGHSCPVALLVTLAALIVMTQTIRSLSGWLGERWGGLLIGLPIQALTLLDGLWERGPHYAALVAQTGLLGLGATVAFAKATARCLSRSRRQALAVAEGTATSASGSKKCPLCAASWGGK
jgi:hypothetical protein